MEQTPTEQTSLERTLSIIKPDATARNLTEEVNAILEGAGLRVIAQKHLHLTETQAQEFYAVHRERPFYNDLVAYMTSAAVVVQVLEGEGAVARNREMMGATDPAQAAEGTIRQKFGESIERNVVHGSDSAENAKSEIAFFFKDLR
ncbi:MAG: nucleoside-diphosphate kinase [Alphaproteobacteria bacterium]